MKEQEIGELYKDKLSGYEAKPNPAVWDGIANAAPVKRFNRARQFRFWGLRAGVPALFTAAVVIVAIALWRPTTSSEETPTPQNRTAVTQISQPEKTQQITEQPTINTPVTPTVPVRTIPAQLTPITSESTQDETTPTVEMPIAELPSSPTPLPTMQAKILPLTDGNGKPITPIFSNPDPENTQTTENHPSTQKEDFRLTYSHDTLVCRNSKLTLFVNNADHVFWSFGSDLESVELIIEENTRVEAMVHTKEGKDTTIRVNITVCDCELFIPTAFTPNGDGLNDEWMVYAPAGITDFECMIYDKAGTLLFHTRNIHQGWNGMNNGKYLSAGGYFYSCRYRDELGNLHVQKGQLTLVR